jgi:hypothetical protein
VVWKNNDIWGELSSPFILQEQWITIKGNYYYIKGNNGLALPLFSLIWKDCVLCQPLFSFFWTNNGIHLALFFFFWSDNGFPLFSSIWKCVKKSCDHLGVTSHVVGLSYGNVNWYQLVVPVM